MATRTSTSTRATVRSCHAAAALFALALQGCAPQHGTIGAVLAQQRDRTLLVREAPKGLAAEKSGVKPGDQILLLDGRDVRPMSAEQVHAALSGEVGDEVKLTLVRDTRILRVTLHRTPAPARPAAARAKTVTLRAD